jgi:hypothetical protein
MPANKTKNPATKKLSKRNAPPERRALRKARSAYKPKRDRLLSPKR